MAAGDQLRHFAIEKGQQQRGDMGAVDIGVGHDDDALIAQIARRDICAPVPQPSACTRSDSSWFCCSLPAPALATFRILPRSGRIAWVSRSRACLALPPALSPSTRKISVPSRRVAGAVGQLAGQAQLAGRGLARDFLFLPPLQPVFGLVDDEVQQLVGFGRAFRQPMVEMIAHHVLDQALGVGR